MRTVCTNASIAPIDDNTSQGHERRAASRIQTVLRVARVIADHDEGLARVRNISDQGAQLRLQIPVLPGDTLVLELAEGLTMAGQVVWTSGDDCGLQFYENIDCADLLAMLADYSKRSKNRPVRLPVATSALTRSENGIRMAGIADVSQRGMKLRHDGSFTEGLQVEITLRSGLKRRGVVRWSKDNMAGVMLIEPFCAEDLGSAINL